MSFQFAVYYLFNKTLHVESTSLIVENVDQFNQVTSQPDLDSDDDWLEIKWPKRKEPEKTVAAKVLLLFYDTKVHWGAKGKDLCVTHRRRSTRHTTRLTVRALQVHLLHDAMDCDEPRSTASNDWALRQSLSEERWQEAKPKLLDSLLASDCVYLGPCDQCSLKEAVIRAEEQPFFDGVFLANDKDVATFVDCVREKITKIFVERLWTVELLKHYILERLLTRVTHALQQPRLDIDYLDFVCRQEIVFLDAVAQHIHMSQDVTERLTDRHNAIQIQRDAQLTHPEVQVDRQSIRDQELDSMVISAVGQNDLLGPESVRAQLRSAGVLVQRRRVRASMLPTNPDAAVLRATSQRLHRRTYRVSGPNSLWHLDGCHKLISFPCSSNNNRSRTVLQHFNTAVTRYGLPSQVRCDYGGENIDVCLFMNVLHGMRTRNVLRGQSTHNQRIERFWRDLWCGIIGVYHGLFTFIESKSIIDPANELHIWALHYVYLPRINRDLRVFCRRCNNHGLRTEGFSTPVQLFVRAYLQLQNRPLRDIQDERRVSPSPGRMTLNITLQIRTRSAHRVQNDVSDDGSDCMFVEHPLAGSEVRVSKRAFQWLNRSRMTIFAQELAVLVFTKDVLAQSTLTGKSGKGPPPKAQLHLVKVQAITGGPEEKKEPDLYTAPPLYDSDSDVTAIDEELSPLKEPLRNLDSESEDDISSQCPQKYPKLDDDITSALKGQPTEVTPPPAEMISLGGGIKIPKRTFDRLSRIKMSVFTQELAVVIFGREALATSSLTGKKTNKTPPDSIKVNSLIDAVIDRFQGTTPSQVRAVLRQKCNNESYAKRNHESGVIKASHLSDAALSPEFQRELFPNIKTENCIVFNANCECSCNNLQNDMR
ncbi:hypothetical protein E1301_Tti021148 [Triplophysa tibetana]|uniref:BEN domain-containing protein n=1 Tax=Triplophysa tibetana TaxID=1572043 RepID=A0A5A9PIC4_9TELE|nr:hypothetical protein E1301_Tti021148 [Triplophysa tibetana]